MRRKTRRKKGFAPTTGPCFQCGEDMKPHPDRAWRQEGFSVCSSSECGTVEGPATSKRWKELECDDT